MICTKNFYFFVILLISTLGLAYFAQSSFAATPFFANDALTKNGIEWCQENQMLYEILSLEEWLKHHDYSIEARVCAHLYNDPLWNNTGPDRIENLIERSRDFVEAEIQESLRESKTGLLDIKPAELGDTVVYGTTADGLVTVKIVTNEPMKGKPFLIGITFLKNSGFEKKGLLKDVNYDVHLSQNDTEILSIKGEYEQDGSIEYSTKPLPNSNPVDIDINIIGIGNEVPFSEPRDAKVSFHVIPEFETILLVLGLLISFTVITTKTQKFPIRL